MSKTLQKIFVLLICTLMMGAFTLTPTHSRADDEDPAPKADSVWGSMKYSGHYIKKGSISAGHGIKKGSIKAGEGIEKGGKATGRGFKKAGKSIKKFFVGDS